MPDLRRLVALICIVVVAFATIVPAASGHFTDVLLPLWVVLFPVLCLFVVLRREHERNEQPIGLQSLLAARAPPRLSA